MIGEIKLPDGSTASLDDNGEWGCDDELMTQFLNQNANPNKVGGMSVVLPFGYGAVIAAQKITGGTIAKIPKVEPLKPGELA